LPIQGTDGARDRMEKLIERALHRIQKRRSVGGNLVTAVYRGSRKLREFHALLLLSGLFKLVK